MNKTFVKKVVFLLGIFLLLLWGGFHFFFWIDRKQEAKLIRQNYQTARLTKADIAQLQEGDIILRRGYGFFSDLIANKLNDSIFDVTHSGILYLKGEQWRVIHTLSSDASDTDGMQEQALSEFLRHSMPEKIIVVRVKNSNKEQRKQIVTRAAYYLAKKVPFDRIGTFDEPSKMYCTELIWQILETDLRLISLPKNQKERESVFYSMTGTYDTTYFDIIINKYPDFQKEPKMKK